MSTMDLEIAAGFGECCVCFEPLCAKGASVMTDGSGRDGGLLRAERLPNRVCRHFLCQEVREMHVSDGYSVAVLCYDQYSYLCC